jgi:transposase
MGSTKPISKGQGERYTATVVPNGYLWRETTYASLSTYTAVAKVPLLRIEILKRSDDMKGFVLLPRRWVVERTSQEGKQSALRSSHLSRKPCPRNSMAGRSALCPGWRKSLSGKGTGLLYLRARTRDGGGARRLRATKPKTCRVSRSSGQHPRHAARGEAPRR